MNVISLSELAIKAGSYCSKLSEKLPACLRGFSPKPKEPLKFDIFCKQNIQEHVYGFGTQPGVTGSAKYFLSKNPCFGIEEYNKLKPEELAVIRTGIAYDTATYAKTILNSAGVIKQLFDRKYGQDKYVFISVGRSFGALAKCLEFMGVDAKAVSFSGCYDHHSSTELIENIVSQKGFDNYKKYLLQQGIDRNLIKSSKKTYLFCDYACTGSTLTIFKKMLEHPELGIEPKNCKYIKLNRVLENISMFVEKDNEVLSRELDKYILKLPSQAFDEYTGIKYLSFDKLGDIVLQKNKKETEIVKKINFCFLDMLKKNNN